MKRIFKIAVPKSKKYDVLIIRNLAEGEVAMMFAKF